MFETPVESIDQLSDEELAALLIALDDGWNEVPDLPHLDYGSFDEKKGFVYDDDFDPEEEEGVDTWFYEWAKPLQRDRIWDHCTFPGYSEAWWIGNPQTHRYWVYVTYDGGCFIAGEIETQNGEPTKESIWPIMKQLINSEGFLNGGFDVNSKWIPKEEIRELLVELSEPDNNFDVDEWIAEQFD